MPLQGIESVKFVASAKGGIFGSGVQEYRITDSKGASTHLYVSVSEMKDRGLTRRYDHGKRVEEWLNTNEGKVYLQRKFLDVFVTKRIRGENPTRRQKQAIESAGHDPNQFLVVKNQNKTILIIHRQTGKKLVISMQG